MISVQAFICNFDFFRKKRGVKAERGKYKDKFSRYGAEFYLESGKKRGIDTVS
jgi:hypothetical protein